MADTRFMNRLRFIMDKRVTVANLIDKAAAAHDDKPVFWLDREPDCGGLGETITAGQLLRFASRFGTLLTGRLGLERWERVAVIKGNHGDIVLMGMAVMRAGLITVPINGGMAAPTARNYLHYTGASCLITDYATLVRLAAEEAVPDGVRHILVTDGGDDGAASCDTLDPRAIDLKRALQAVPDDAWMPPADLATDDDVLICHTSGTTGTPKGVLHSSGTLIAGVKGQLKIEPILRSDIMMSASPFNHFINHLGTMAMLAARARAWLVGAENARELLDLIDREKITVVFCFPHTYQAMLEEGLEHWSLDSVRIWLAGADSSHEANIKPFVERGAFARLFGRRLMTSLYSDTLGSSEVGFAALFRFASRRSKRFGRLAGKPTFAGPRIRIADAHGRTLPNGEVGRMMVKGPTLFKGYWNAHDKLHGVVRDGWWWTGDVGYRDRRGRFYHYDRDVDVIHTAGGPIYSLPVEEALLNQDGVAEAVVIGVPDGNGAHKPIALLQPAADAEMDPDRIVRQAGDECDDARALARVFVVSEAEIPRGLTGKVLKRELRERYASTFSGAADASSGLEARVPLGAAG